MVKQLDTRPDSKSEDARFRIAEVALELFLSDGFENVTIDDVAVASGISRRTIFRYFSGKHELAFPDHAGRRQLLQTYIDQAAAEDDPIEVALGGAELMLRDFLARRDLVLKRYQLTRSVPQLREREVIEHERYELITRNYLRRALPLSSAPYEAVAITALVDAVHRAVLSQWLRLGATTDALADFMRAREWILCLLRGNSAGAVASESGSDGASQTPPQTGASAWVEPLVHTLKEVLAGLEQHVADPN
jgi:AcrR family transcriptional regulator